MKFIEKKKRLTILQDKQLMTSNIIMYIYEKKKKRV